MDRFYYLIVLIIILPIFLGSISKFEYCKNVSNNISEGLFIIWVRGSVICLGITGLCWKIIVNSNGIPKYRFVICTGILLIFIIYLFYKYKSKADLIYKTDNSNWKSLFIFFFLWFFGLCIVEDTAYINDVSNIMSKGIGESLFTVVGKMTDMKQEKMVLFLFPLLFSFISYGIVQGLSNVIGLQRYNKKCAIFFLLLFIFLPLWDPEWNTYSLFGRGYDTRTIFACVFSPLFLMWLSILINMLKNKEYNFKKALVLVFYLVILIGFFNLLQVLKYSIANTSLSSDIINQKLQEPHSWLDAIKTTRAALTVYGVGRYNFAMIIFCMLILLYIRDYKNSNVLLTISVLIFLIFMPPLTILIIKLYGLQIYSGLLTIIPLPLICTYTYIRVEEKCNSRRGRIIVFLLACAVILWCCYHNFDMWHNPRVLVGMKGSD